MSDSILASLFSQQQHQQFKTSWPEEPFIKHGLSSRFPALFSHPLLQNIESLTEAYQGRVLAADRHQNDEMTPINDDYATQAVEDGFTLYMDDLTPLIPEATAFLHQLESELGMPRGIARIGAFVSPPGNGAPCHFDVTEVISVRLVGHKQFNIAPLEQIRYPYGMQYSPSTMPFDDLYPQMNSAAPDYTQQNFTSITMQPGSVLYMPRGTWHNTLANERSLAVSIILQPPTQLDSLLEQLTSTLLQDKNWRRPCYGKPSDKQLTHTLYKTLPNIIEKLITRERDPESPSRMLTPKSRFIRIPSAEVKIENKKEHCDIRITVQLEAGEKQTAKLSAPIQSGEVIQWISDRKEPFTGEALLKQFPKLSWDFLVQIVDVAQQSLLIKFLWFDPL